VAGCGRSGNSVLEPDVISDAGLFIVGELCSYNSLGALAAAKLCWKQLPVQTADDRRASREARDGGMAGQVQFLNSSP